MANANNKTTSELKKMSRPDYEKLVYDTFGNEEINLIC